jgi:hypothetical protein
VCYSGTYSNSLPSPHTIKRNDQLGDNVAGSRILITTNLEIAQFQMTLKLGTGNMVRSLDSKDCVVCLAVN